MISNAEAERNAAFILDYLFALGVAKVSEDTVKRGLSHVLILMSEPSFWQQTEDDYIQ